MRQVPVFLVFLLLFSTLVAQQHKNVFLLDNWTTDTLMTHGFDEISFNETWGFVIDGEEYAVIGSTEGTHFFHITEDDKLEPVDFVRGKFSSPQVVHRDFHDYGGYLYAVCDEGSSSLQIIDLQYLPDSVHVAAEDSIQFGRIHNIFIDSSSALLYVCKLTPLISNPTFSFTSMKVFSLADPLNPVEVFGGFEHIGEVHDAYVINDTAYLNCGYDGLHIYDFSHPSTPVLLGSMTIYQDQGYNHSGWLSPDRKYYYFVDETEGKRIKKVNVEDIANPTIVGIFGSNFTQGSIPHNVMATDKLIFVSYYNEGFRVYDTRFKPPKEVAYYDTYPSDEGLAMTGAWGVYSLLPSKRILVSDMKNGLFLFRFEQEVFEVPPSSVPFSVFPNPAASGSEVIFRFYEDNISKIKFYLYNNLGQLIYSESNEFNDYWKIRLDYAAGSYNYIVYYENYLGEETLRQGHLILHD